MKFFVQEQRKCYILRRRRLDGVSRVRPPFNSMRNDARQLGQNMEKENSSKMNETQGFLTLGNSNWTICSLLN